MRGDWDVWRSGDPEKVWARYFETLGEAARTRHVRHPRPPRPGEGLGRAARRVPDGDLRRFYELAMDGIAESDVAIEVSTAGLRKPVGEIYPARAVPRDVPGGRAARWRCRATPTCPSSSATGTSARWSGSASIGVTELAVFEGRERRLEPIG